MGAIPFRPSICIWRASLLYRWTWPLGGRLLLDGNREKQTIDCRGAYTRNNRQVSFLCIVIPDFILAALWRGKP